MTGDQNMDQQQSDLSSLLEYSKALNQSASSLLKAAQSFERTADKFLKGFDKSSQNLTGSLDRQAKAYDDKQKKDREERDKQEKEYSKDLADELELDNRRRHAENTRMQRIGTAFISTLRTAGSFFIKSFTGAYTRVSDAYEQNLERITTSLQITNREYTTQLNNITRQIWGQGLAKQFSQIDWQKAMGDTLSTGLRGEAATNMAYRNMIANKLLPAIQTNTRAYVQMSKRFGADFEKNMLAFGKHVEKIYGAEGLEQGKIDQMLNTLQAQIRYTAAQKGLSTEDTNKMLNRLTASISFLESRNIDSDEFIQNLYESATTTPGGLSNIMSYVNGIGTPGQTGRTLTSGLDQYLANYINSYLVYGGNANAMVARTSALGGNVQNAYAINAALGFGQVDLGSTLADVSKMVDDFESGKAYNGLIDQLTSGQYSSATTQYEKWMENQTAIIANELTNALPHNTQVLASVWQIVRAWFTAWQAGQVGQAGQGVLNRSNGIRNFLNRDLGLKNGYTSGVTSRGTTWYRNAATNRFVSASEAQRVGLGGATTVGSNLLNIAAGPGALIAGAGWTAYDAVRAGIAADKAGLGTGGAIGSVFRGMLTGGMADDKATKDSKLAAALQGQGQKFSWGDVLKNAGKGALIGTGIGTAAGGWAAGTGTVIGAAAGGIIGAVANVIDQAVENAKYNKLAEATKKYTESLDSLTESTNDYIAGLKRTESLQAAINVTQDKSKKGTKEYSDAVSTILRYYPEYTETIEKAGGVSKQLAQTLESVDKYENLLLQKKLWDAAKDAEEKRKDYAGASGQFADKLKEAAGFSLASKLSAEMSPEEIGDAVSSVAGKYGLTSSEVVTAYNNVVKSVDDRSGWSKFWNPTSQLTSPEHGGTTYSLYGDSTVLDKVKSSGYVTPTGEVVLNDENMFDSRQRVLQGLELAKTEYQNYMSLLKVWDSLEQLDKDRLVSQIKGLVSDYRALANEGRMFYGIEFNSSMPFDIIGSHQDMLSAFGGEVPRFKVGAYSIGSDNTPALLHAGEMVLTSSDANALRELASGQGVRGLLSGLLSISRASAVAADDSTTAANPIIEAIHLQTRTLSEHLINILSEVKEISRIQRNQSSVSSGVSRDLRTYQGV